LEVLFYLDVTRSDISYPYPESVCSADSG